MTKQEKQLLTKDLCARLPYGVKGKVKTTDGNGKEIKDEGVLNSVFINDYGKAYICIDGAEYELDDFKPYLRPMSSLTFEEFKKIHLDGDILYNADDKIVISESWETVDYMNEIMIDYRDLIGKGLALKVPEGMYK